MTIVGEVSISRDDALPVVAAAQIEHGSKLIYGVEGTDIDELPR